VVVRALLTVAVVVATAACSSGGGRDADGDVEAWCGQLDVAVTASAEVDELAADDPGVDDALATVQEEMGALADLEAPPAVADDWDTLSGPPPTNDTGGFDLDGAFADAGDRIATWALQECDLSSGARTALEDSRDD